MPKLSFHCDGCVTMLATAFEHASISDSGRVISAVRLDGFAFLSDCTRLVGDVAEWDRFAAEWNELPLDGHMGDGGRYRRRRYGAFHVARSVVRRLPHRAHHQDKRLNALNGGYDRWFAPLDDRLANSSAFMSLTISVAEMIDRLGARSVNEWDVEAHQFRIEATGEEVGLPTPEGPHRDGRDWVFLMVVARENVEGGETSLYEASGLTQWSRTLAAGDGLLIDDSRLLHSTSAIHPHDARLPGRRDVLVLTFKAARDMGTPLPALVHTREHR